MTILERIKLNSAKHPERVVMRTQYGFGEMTMKWGELDAFSDKLAYYLTKELRTNKPIIVYGHKHPMMLVCFLACVKSGRAYCPIDVNVPLSRTEAIIREVEPEIILTTEPLEIDSDRIKELQEINEIISTKQSRVTQRGICRKLGKLLMVRKRDRKGGALNVASPFKSNLFIFCAAINKEQEKTSEID